MSKVYLVYEQTDMFTIEILKVFKNESDADNYCNELNTINKPEFDQWGLVDGVFYNYYEMDVE